MTLKKGDLGGWIDWEVRQAVHSNMITIKHPHRALLGYKKEKTVRWIATTTFVKVSLHTYNASIFMTAFSYRAH